MDSQYFCFSLKEVSHIVAISKYYDFCILGIVSASFCIRSKVNTLSINNQSNFDQSEKCLEILRNNHFYSPVPRLSFATRFDTKLREKSFEKQYSAKAVLFTMYVPTVGICTQICARTWAHYNEISHASAQVKTAFTEFWVKTKIFLRAEKYF